MRSLVISLIMLAAVGIPVAAQTGKSSYVPPAQQTVAAGETGAIVAYSDTTSVDTAGSHATVDDDDDYPWSSSVLDGIDRVDDPFDLIAFLTTLGVGGVIVAIFFVLLCLLTVLSPVILIVLVLYLLLRRKRDRYQVIEKAIEKGRDIPEDIRHSNFRGNDDLLRQGIKHVAIGVGAIVFSVVMDFRLLLGIGLFVMCYGGGQVAIAYTTKRNDGGNGNKDRGKEADNAVSDDAGEEEQEH